MIDIKFLRENPDAVRENIRKKFQDAKLPLVDEAIRLDAEKRAAQQECEQLKAARNKLSKANGPLYGQLKKADEAQKAELQKQIDDLTSQITEVKDSAEGSENKISTYDQLLSAYASYSDGDIEAAGNALGNVNEEYLSDSAKSVYETINAQVNADYLESLYNQGYSDYNSQKFEESITSLQKVVDMEETYKDGYALYYLAQAYRKNNDLETAKTYYQKIVELYPGTERAANAQNYINIEE